MKSFRDAAISKAPLVGVFAEIPHPVAVEVFLPERFRRNGAQRMRSRPGESFSSPGLFLLAQ